MAAPVPLGKRASYAAPAFALAAVGIPVTIHLSKFYTDVVGVPVALFGALVLAGRLFDAVTDPLIGWASDHTRTRWGRRRPYILLGSLPLGLAFLMLFSPPELEPRAATVWLGAWLFLLYLFWTLVVVPYEALGPELTFDYDERTSLLGARDGTMLLGIVAAAIAPLFIAMALRLSPSAEDQRTKFLALALLYVPLVVGCCWWCVRRIRELPQSPAPAPPDGRLAGVWDNKPFLVLLAAYTIGALGSNLPPAVFYYYVEYVMRRPEAADRVLAIYFLSAVVFLPCWIWLSHKLEKRTTYIASLVLHVLAIGWVFFLGPEQFGLYQVLCLVAGACFGAQWAIPSAMQGDVIDHDELLTGRRREGIYVGLWAVSRKLAGALSLGLALPILGLAGYRPNVEQTGAVRLALRWMYIGVPCLFHLAAVAVMLWYPITRERHAAIRRAIDARARASLDFHGAEVS